MYNDLQDEQTIIVYENGLQIYSGTVGDMPGNIRNSRAFAGADFYLLDAVEDAEILAVY